MFRTHNLGHTMIKHLYNIHPKLLFIAILFIGLLPTLLVLSFFFNEKEELNHYEEHLEFSENTLLYQAKKHNDNLNLHRFHLGAHSNYFQTNFTEIPLLEGPVEKYLQFKETEVFLQKPILIYSDKIIKILENLEEPTKEHPQLIIKDFQIERVPSVDEKVQFKLNIKLLKRDFL